MYQSVPRTRSDDVIRKWMMGPAAAAAVLMVPIIVSARVQHILTTKSTRKTAINSMPIGTFKYKSAKHKPGTYGSSKSRPSNLRGEGKAGSLAR
jgi:hypothetical protein